MRHLLTVAALASLLAATPTLAQNPQGPGADTQAPHPSASQPSPSPGGSPPTGCEQPGATISASGQPCLDTSASTAPSTTPANPGAANPPAAAQSTQPTTPPSAGPPSSTATNPLPPSSGTDVAAGETFIDQQTKDQHLASEIIGMDVQNAAGDKIGGVKDILVSEDGRIVAVLIGVGGFLGIGEKSVALSFDALQPAADKNGDMILMANLEKDALTTAPDFKTLADQQKPAPADPLTTGSTPTR